VVVPWGSEVIRVTRRGTLDQLLELFDKGLASPFSVEENSGWTLLHVRFQMLDNTTAKAIS